MLEFIRKMR